MGGTPEETGTPHTVALEQEVTVVQENQASSVTVEMAQGEGWCQQLQLAHLFSF